MEMLREVIIDFVLFSFVEGLLYEMFFNKVCKCKKFTLIEIILMSIGNCLISCIVPVFYQVIIIMWMTFCLFLKNKTDRIIFTYLKYSFLAMVGQLVTEGIGMMFYEFILHIDFIEQSKIIVFCMMIPIRIIQLLAVIMIGGSNMKGWFGGVVRK